MSRYYVAWGASPQTDRQIKFPLKHHHTWKKCIVNHLHFCYYDSNSIHLHLRKSACTGKKK